jgi:hypothetical protein
MDFTRQKRRQPKLNKRIADSDTATGMFLKLINLETQFSKEMENSSPAAKALAPNRHGILHGSIEHLDYGTEINSFKTFSLLAFISFILRKT